MAKLYTTLVGGVLLLVGLLGFLPAVNTTNDHGSLLLGFIQINPAQSVIHILTGIVALGALASARAYYLKAYVQVFGVVYALVALWGIAALGSLDVNAAHDSVLFGLIHVNFYTEMVHVLIAVFGLYVGFMAGDSKKAVKV
jgi:hypothetical protein